MWTVYLLFFIYYCVHTVMWQQNNKKVNRVDGLELIYSQLKWFLFQRPTSVRHLGFIKISHIALHYSPSAYMEISSALLCRSCYWIMRWHVLLLSRHHHIINVHCCCVWGFIYCYNSAPSFKQFAFTSVKKGRGDYLFITQILWSHFASSYMWCWYWWCHGGPLLEWWLSLNRLARLFALCSHGNNVWCLLSL